jgi:DNA-binding HxlR family transcriptional regulator
MNTAQEEYTFSKSEIRILRELTKGERSLSNIEKALSIKPPLLSYNLKRLLKKGIIKETSKGFRKHIQFNDSKHASLLRDLLIIHDHIDWQNLLTGKAIEILFKVITASGKEFNEVSKTTLWRHLRNLKAHGIVRQTKKGYEINPRFSTLTDFLNEYQRFIINMLARTISEKAVVLWQRDLEFLIRAPKNTGINQENFLRTATSLLTSMGIPIFSESDIYFYSKKKRSIHTEDVILHTLLIEPNNVRYVTYSLLLLKKYGEKIDTKCLMKQAEKYNLDSQIKSMLQFLETHSPQKGLTLPTWTEFEAKARDYNVIT